MNNEELIMSNCGIRLRLMIFKIHPPKADTLIIHFSLLIINL